jgi:centromeric protein E
MSSILSFAGSMVDTLLGNSIISPTKDLEPTDESIQVCVRIRPILTNEREDSYAWMWEENTIYPHIPTQMPYTFDHLFYPENSNDDIFNSVVKTIVLRSMKGYHGSVFTYGQTSSGKTFTMNGSQSQPGIIPQSIFYCFESIQEHFTDREFLFRVCYIEVYNEQVKDLLSTEPTQIKIQHDPKLGTILSGVKEQVVLNPQQVIALLKAGEAHRHVGTTDMNEKSSRAHTLFKLIIESKKRGDDADAPVRVSNLNLVDLAGSENAKMTNSVGERAREAKYINQSLLTLSLIIQRLSEEKPGAKGKQYLPYRDSKLTRLLQQSLSGNAQIAVICTVSPTLRCVDESHNTLKFAARAKKIKTSATINELIDDKTLLRAYKMEIHLLKVRLAAMEGQPRDNSLRPSDSNKNGSGDSRDAYSFSEEDQRDENDEDGEGVILQVLMARKYEIYEINYSSLASLCCICYNQLGTV